MGIGHHPGAAALVPTRGNDPELVELATRNAQAIAAGHCFVIFLRDGFPVNILNPVKAVPEVCTIHCATANPVDILVAVTPRGRGIVGVIDGQPPSAWRPIATWPTGTTSCAPSVTSSNRAPVAERGEWSDHLAWSHRFRPHRSCIR